MRIFTVILALWATQASAQDWALRDGDAPLDAAAVATRIVGTELHFYDDGLSRHHAGGSYSYTYSAQNGGGTAFGQFEVAADGTVCIRFRNGFDRCDRYVENGTRLVLLTEEGERYPIRP